MTISLNSIHSFRVMKINLKQHRIVFLNTNRNIQFAYLHQVPFPETTCNSLLLNMHAFYFTKFYNLSERQHNLLDWDCQKNFCKSWDYLGLTFIQSSYMLRAHVLPFATNSSKSSCFQALSNRFFLFCANQLFLLPQVQGLSLHQSCKLDKLS